MQQQPEKMSKKVVYGISVTTPVVVVLLLNHYFYYANVLPELSKWPRRGILLVAVIILSYLLSSILLKIWPALACCTDKKRAES